MRNIEPTAKFKKDYKSIRQQNFFDEEELRNVIGALANDIPLDEKYQDHPLHGKYEGARECHIKPDWLLIYSKDKDKVRLILMRTGTHSKLFGL